MEQAIVAVVGNPNCGKTTVFNALTGARQAVGNWPGVTVEKKVGRLAHDGYALEVVDLPGTYSLSFGESASTDERIARNYVAEGHADVVLNILDAANLERNLLVTAQLLEMRVPMVIGLNMMDMARRSGMEIDIDALSRSLGCPVVPIVASRGRGVEELLNAVTQTLRQPKAPATDIRYSDELEAAIAEAMGLNGLIPDHATGAYALTRFAAIQALEDPETIAPHLPQPSQDHLQCLIRRTEKLQGDSLDMLFADGRYDQITAIARDCIGYKGRATTAISDRIDHYALSRLFGLPIFLGVMYLMFLFAINVGGAFIDFFDIAFGAIFVDGFGQVLESIGAPVWLIAILANGIGGGIQTVATFIPVIAGLFLFLSALEDSGYMARAAFVMDRLMRMVGLPGKAFVPLVVGFGCTVPAVMAARTLDNPRDRILTSMMAPFISCGARLPVYVLFAAAFFPSNGQNLVFVLYLLGILAAVGTGYMLKHTLLVGETSPFIMELPPYHLPQMRSLLIRTWTRLKSFVVGAGQIIVVMVTVLSFANSLGTDMTFGNEDTDKSVLATVGKSITPALAPMGIEDNNWPATVGLFTGIFAKEAVVGTLNALYGAQANDGAEDADFDLGASLSEAFATIPENLLGVTESLDDPMGLKVGDLSDSASAAEEQEVSTTTFGTMARLFDGQVGAFAYLLMILLYMPCAAAMGAIYRETGPVWATFAAVWTTGLGYGLAVLVYQVGTFGRHPLSASLAIGCVIVGFVTSIVALRRMHSRMAPASSEEAS